jgi:dephospho-CoA kinase
MPRSRLIIGLAGSVGAGKGTAADYLIRRYGAEVFLFSGPLRRILEILRMDGSRVNFQYLSKVLRDAYGQDLFSVVAKKTIDESDRKVIVIDGARRVSDLDGIATDPNFRLVYIDSDVKTRYERIVKRGQNRGDGDKTFEEFLKEENAEAETTIRALKDQAHLVIENDSGEAEFYAAIDEFV